MCFLVPFLDANMTEHTNFEDGKIFINPDSHDSLYDECSLFDTSNIYKPKKLRSENSCLYSNILQMYLQANVR